MVDPERKKPDILVHIDPLIPDSPLMFYTDHAHDSATILTILEKHIGLGRLYDSQKATVVPDPKWVLAAGVYTYKCKFVMQQAAMLQGQPVSMECERPFGTPAWAPQSGMTIRDQYVEEAPLYAVKAVSSATEEDLQRALGYLNFEIVNGHEYGMSDGRFKLPKPAQGTMKCGAFDPEKGRDFHKGLAEYHKECLKRLHVPMGTDGYNVLELSHKEGYLLDILIGSMRFMGSLNSAALPGIIAELSAAYYIRVGFVQIYRSKNIASSSAGSEGNPLEVHEPQLVISMLAATFNTQVPLDFVSTDGVTYNLYRFHEKKLLKYDQLSAEEAYFALADRLKTNVEVKAAVLDPTKDLLKEFPEEETMAHRTLKEMIPSEPW